LIPISPTNKLLLKALRKTKKDYNRNNITRVNRSTPGESLPQEGGLSLLPIDSRVNQPGNITRQENKYFGKGEKTQRLKESAPESEKNGKQDSQVVQQ
jgi:hypothetical protein